MRAPGSYLPALRSGFERLAGHASRGAAAYGMLLISLLFTLLAWAYVSRDIQEQNSSRFVETVRATRAAIDRRTDSYLDSMFGARGLFYASKMVERGEWTGYVEGVEPEDRLQGLQALGYAERVDPGEREAFEREMRAEGQPSLRPDLDPGGERTVYFPVKFMAPTDQANRAAVGFDNYTDPAHKAAIDRARDTGSAQATGMTQVLTTFTPNSDADLSLRPGFAVYLPVYQGGEVPRTVAERRRSLEGFVVGYFRRDGLLEGIFEGGFDPAIDFEVYDGRGASGPLVYDDDGVKRAGESNYDPLFSDQDRIAVAGREWSLYFSTLSRFEERSESPLPLLVLVSGTVVSLLLFAIILVLVRSRVQAERAQADLEDANRELEGTNEELEAFSYSVSHDLRAPLRTIDGFSQILAEDYANQLDQEGLDYLGRVRSASQHMGNLIDDLLDLSRVGRRPLRRELVDLSVLAEDVVEELRRSDPERRVEFLAEKGVTAWGDVNLLKIAFENLLGNAWKFTRDREPALIEFGAAEGGNEPAGSAVYYVRDNGAGFDAAYADKLFGAFQRLHGSEEFEGTGIGLATVQRIVHRHGGRVWAQSAVGEGATFFFTLGGKDRMLPEAPARKTEIA